MYQRLLRFKDHKKADQWRRTSFVHHRSFTDGVSPWLLDIVPKQRPDAL